jgi:hypothetical protein
VAWLVVDVGPSDLYGDEQGAMRDLQVRAHHGRFGGSWSLEVVSWSSGRTNFSILRPGRTHQLVRLVGLGDAQTANAWIVGKDDKIPSVTKHADITEEPSLLRETGIASTWPSLSQLTWVVSDILKSGDVARSRPTGAHAIPLASPGRARRRCRTQHWSRLHDAHEHAGNHASRFDSRQHRRSVLVTDRNPRSAPTWRPCTTPHAPGGTVHRYYDPQTGQFLTVDPAVAKTGEPFSYAVGDPVNLSDPSGLQGGGGGNYWDRHPSNVTTGCSYNPFDPNSCFKQGYEHMSPNEQRVDKGVLVAAPGAIICLLSGVLPCVGAAAGTATFGVALDTYNNCSAGQIAVDSLLGFLGACFAGLSALGEGALQGAFLDLYKTHQALAGAGSSGVSAC